MSSELLKGKRIVQNLEITSESSEEVEARGKAATIGEKPIEPVAPLKNVKTHDTEKIPIREELTASKRKEGDLQDLFGKSAKLEKQKERNLKLKDREEQIKKYMPMIKRVISRLMVKYPPVFEEDELIDIGVIGFIEALNRYVPKGITFEQYAELRIRGAILDELRRNDLFSRSLRQQVKRFNVMRSNLEHQLGKTPSSEELAKAMNVSPRTVEQLRIKAQPIQFIDIDSVESSPLGKERELSDNTLLPDDIAHRRELREKVLKALERLPERERLILHLYYFEDLTMRKIGEFIGLSESRICQLHRNACKSLRNLLEEEDLL